MDNRKRKELTYSCLSMAFDPFKNAFYGPFRLGWATFHPDRFEGHTGDFTRQNPGFICRKNVPARKLSRQGFLICYAFYDDCAAPMISADSIFLSASRWEKMMLVVLMSECPSHSWIIFIGTFFACRSDAQECRSSWKRICRSPFFFSRRAKCFET